VLFGDPDQAFTHPHQELLVIVVMLREPHHGLESPGGVHRAEIVVPVLQVAHSLGKGGGQLIGRVPQDRDDQRRVGDATRRPVGRDPLAEDLDLLAAHRALEIARREQAQHHACGPERLRYLHIPGVAHLDPGLIEKPHFLDVAHVEGAGAADDLARQLFVEPANQLGRGTLRGPGVAEVVAAGVAQEEPVVRHSCGVV
jgi:hypothetical protein